MPSLWKSSYPAISTGHLDMRAACVSGELHEGFVQEINPFLDPGAAAELGTKRLALGVLDKFSRRRENDLVEIFLIEGDPKLRYPIQDL
jgi:hypothetical protein